MALEKIVEEEKHNAKIRYNQEKKLISYLDIWINSNYEKCSVVFRNEIDLRIRNTENRLGTRYNSNQKKEIFESLLYLKTKTMFNNVERYLINRDSIFADEFPKEDLKYASRLGILYSFKNKKIVLTKKGEEFFNGYRKLKGLNSIKEEHERVRMIYSEAMDSISQKDGL